MKLPIPEKYLQNIPHFVCHKKFKSIVCLQDAILLCVMLFAFEAKSLEPLNSCEGLVIKTIYINNQNVFNTMDSNENGVFYQSANFLHIKTRQKPLRSQLLFKEGDTYSERKAKESERILRSNKYIRDAEIVATRQGDQALVYVTTYDTWSAKPTVSFGRTGGVNKSEIGLEEDNLLGLGIHLEASYSRGIDRTSENITVIDNQIFNSRYNGMIQHSNLSDGQLDLISVEKPFFSLNSHFAHGVSYRDENKIGSLYFLGDKYFEWKEQEKEINMYLGWSKGLIDGNVLRHTIGYHIYENHAEPTTFQPVTDNIELEEYLTDFTIPSEITEIFPYYSFEFLQDNFDTTVNHDKIARTEDIYLGSKFAVQFGFVNSVLGSNENYFKLKALAEKHLQLSDKFFLTTGFGLDLDYLPSTSEIDNGLFSYYAKIYGSQTDHSRFYADFTGLQSHNLRYNRQLFLDDNSGFRGYPLRYLSGTNMQKMTLEHRYFFEHNLWRVFNFGAAVFLDVGHISSEKAFENDQSGTYKSIGVGLRIASNRSSRGNIIHIDLAKPLDAPDDLSKWQLTIVTKATF